jgi:hypothetical protein
MQAITTRFLPPTNHRGARIVARCQARRIVVPYEYGGDAHAKAAEKLANLLGWKGTWVGGGLPEGTGDCFVLVNPNYQTSADTFTVEETRSI